MRSFYALRFVARLTYRVGSLAILAAVVMAGLHLFIIQDGPLSSHHAGPPWSTVDVVTIGGVALWALGKFVLAPLAYWLFKRGGGEDWELGAW